jgi:hypothetical protein
MRARTGLEAPDSDHGGRNPYMADDTDELVEEDEDLPIDDDEDEAEPTPEDLADATVAPEPGLGEVESIQDLLAKQEASETAKEAVEEENEVVPLDLARDDRAEPIDTKVVPMQETEFMCKRCFLVKHRSQLADKKKMLCRDCA